MLRIRKLICLATALGTLLLPGIGQTKEIDLDSLLGNSSVKGKAIDLPAGGERLIVFGGIGTLKIDPEFIGFVETNGLHHQARNIVRDARLGTSSISVRESDLLDALSRELGRQADYADIDDMVKAGQLYTVSLVSSLEHRLQDVVLLNGKAVGRQIFMVSLTAVLSRTEDGVVVLAAPAAEARAITLDASQADIDRIRPELYGALIPKALQSLDAMIDRYRRSGEERHMVSAVMISDKGSNNLFGGPKGPLNPRSVFCEAQVTTGGEGTETWRALSGYLAHDLTGQMAANGIPMVPPAHWSAWARGSENQTKNALPIISFRTAGGYRSDEKTVRIQVSPKDIRNKVILQFGKLIQAEDTDTLTKLTGAKHEYLYRYGAPVRLLAFQTKTQDECATVIGKSVLSQNAKPPTVDSERLMLDLKRPPLEASQRAFGFLALQKAVRSLEFAP